MEAISQTIANSNLLVRKDSMKQPLLCKTSSRMVSLVREKFNSMMEFNMACNPSAQHRYIERPIEAFARDTATMTDLNIAFGEGSACSWLVPQITDLSEFCGCRDKLSPHQIRETAIILSQKYGYIKVSEFLVFFAWMKAGVYGKFYGCLDPMVITSAFIDFLGDRAKKYTQISEEIQKRKAEEDRKIPRCTYAEWLEKKKQRENKEVQL